MRYLNWDVLLFDGMSRIPISEYRTTCFAVEDTEPIQADILNGRDYTRQIPLLTTFIPSLPVGTPFKASIHSWTTPEFSQALLNQTLPLGNIACFEIRVVVDGTVTAGILVQQGMVYPQTIDSLQRRDNEQPGGREILRWPEFHAECLADPMWNATDNMGRIKVTIAEGFCESPAEGPFIRVQNLITFAYQHAPIDVLEESKIAWPCPRMWEGEEDFSLDLLAPPADNSGNSRVNNGPGNSTAPATVITDPFSAGDNNENDGEIPIWMAPSQLPSNLFTTTNPPYHHSGLNDQNDPFVDHQATSMMQGSGTGYGPSNMMSMVTAPIANMGSQATTAANSNPFLDESPVEYAGGLVCPVNSRATSSTHTPNIGSYPGAPLGSSREPFVLLSDSTNLNPFLANQENYGMSSQAATTSTGPSNENRRPTGAMTRTIMSQGQARLVSSSSSRQMLTREGDDEQTKESGAAGSKRAPTIDLTGISPTRVVSRNRRRRRSPEESPTRRKSTGKNVPPIL